MRKAGATVNRAAGGACESKRVPVRYSSGRGEPVVPGTSSTVPRVVAAKTSTATTTTAVEPPAVVSATEPTSLRELYHAYQYRGNATGVTTAGAAPTTDCSLFLASAAWLGVGASLEGVICGEGEDAPSYDPPSAEGVVTAAPASAAAMAAAQSAASLEAADAAAEANVLAEEAKAADAAAEAGVLPDEAEASPLVKAETEATSAAPFEASGESGSKRLSPDSDGCRASDEDSSKGTECAGGEAAAAAGVVAGEDTSWWPLWLSDWHVLPLNRLATLILETLVSGSVALEPAGSKRGSPRSSSSKGSSKRDSSVESSLIEKKQRSEQTGDARQGRRSINEEGGGTDSSSEGTVESCCSCCSSNLCTGSDSDGGHALLLSFRSLRRFHSRAQRLQRSRLAHQRLLRKSSTQRTESTISAACSHRKGSSSAIRFFSKDSHRDSSLPNEDQAHADSRNALQPQHPSVTPSLENWMGTLGLEFAPLEQLIIPATHNSASWRVAHLNEQQAYYCRLVQVWVSCQQLSIYEQLRRGIRWLDLRCCKSLEAVTVPPRMRRRVRHRKVGIAPLARYVSTHHPPSDVLGSGPSGSRYGSVKNMLEQPPAEASSLDNLKPSERPQALAAVASSRVFSPSCRTPRRDRHQHAGPQRTQKKQLGGEAGEAEELATQQERRNQQISLLVDEEASSQPSHRHHHHHSKRLGHGHSDPASAGTPAAAHRDHALATGARRVAVARELEQAGASKHQAIPYCAHGGVLTVPLMRVLEEVRLFLVAHPTEVVFLSCVPDEGVIGETFCRLKDIPATEVYFCVASSLGDFLGPSLEEGVSLSALVKRGQRVILLWSHQERCLPDDVAFPCEKGPDCPCRTASEGRCCYASLAADWVQRVRPVFSAANRSGDTEGFFPDGHQESLTEGMGVSTASSSGSASTFADSIKASRLGSKAALEATRAIPEATPGFLAGRNMGRNVVTSFVPSPFRAGSSRLFKSYYRTGTLHPEELIVNLLRWTSEEQRTVAVQRRHEARGALTFENNQRRPITFRMLCGEVTAPRKFAELPFIKYWFGQGVAAWKEKPTGIKTAAFEANNLLLNTLLRPLLQQIHDWDATRIHSQSNDDATSTTGTEGARNPLQYINVFSHDFADRRIISMLLRINCALHCNLGE
ncbi:uncharacterized protein LOC34619483 [Cyclospora cayetanensis]|uniref:Uncharacterized protein LOC34619483 n=1 Tax=Cyclospora cayetanensis TaxID=88456 RepID=A0A6P6S2N0_9EIME|nr:uncharacterized protein LOC34619483 [Cyclospora cayetanensis]